MRMSRRRKRGILMRMSRKRKRRKIDQKFVLELDLYGARCFLKKSKLMIQCFKKMEKKSTVSYKCIPRAYKYS